MDLHLACEDARATVRPERGAIVTSLSFGGDELLFLDRPTLDDPAKNVRGGVPILFPCAGPLPGGAFVHRGVRHEMRQHGFARERAFAVAESGEGGCTLSLDSDAQTRAAFPFDFRLTLAYRLAARSLAIEAAVENRAVEPLPLHFGLHPYFRVADAQKPRARVECDATRAWDNVAKREVAFPGWDLTAPELDLHALDHPTPSATLQRDDGRRITVSGSPELRHWVVWTLAGRDFVCLEPWTARAGVLDGGPGLPNLIWVAPGATHRLTVTIAFR